MIKLGGGWDEALLPLFESDGYAEIRAFLKCEYARQTVYPDMYDIYNCFRFTPYGDVRAVILGQDPYHGENQAHGLSFSVRRGVKMPPSLVNIFKELKSDLGIDTPTHGDLSSWAKNGVLLLNTSLTVRAGQANSHSGCGWQNFTDEVIKILSRSQNPIAFILWGGNARRKKALIDGARHLIIESAHPSPLSCYNGFFGSKPFSRANAFLNERGRGEIDWRV